MKDIHGCTPLHCAILNNHEDIVKILLSYSECNASIKDELGYTALHWACVAGADYDIIKLLAKKGHVLTRDIEGLKPLDSVSTDHKDYNRIKKLLSCKTGEPYHDLHSVIRSGNIKSFLETKDVNVQDDHGHTLLHLAAQFDRGVFTEELLQKEANANTQDNSGYTPLHVAVMNSNKEIVGILLKHKPTDLGIMDNLGRMPLFLALEKNQPETAWLLLNDKRFDAKRINDNCGDEGNTLLHLAIQSKDIKITNALYGKGADVYVSNYTGLNSCTLITENLKYDKTSYEKLQEFFSTDKLTNADYLEILISPIKKNNFDIVKLLVDSMVDINQKDSEGFTALHFAVEKEDRVRIVEYLIENGAKVNVQDGQGWTPLHWAAQEGNVEIVKLLLDNSADPNKVASSNDFTPLHAVADADKVNIEVAKLLIEKDANVTAETKDGRTPLIIAMEKKYFDLCGVLLGYMKNGEIDKALQGLENRQQGVAEVLLRLIRKCEGKIAMKVLEALKYKKELIKYIVNYKDTQSRTLLYHAAKEGLIDIVKLLLEKDADIYIQEKTKNTILHAAITGKEKEVVLCIINKLEENKKLENYINKEGWNEFTPLYLAALYGSVEIFDLLLKYNAEIPEDKKQPLIDVLKGKSEKKAKDGQKYQEIINRIEKPGKPTTNPGASGNRTVQVAADSSVGAEYFNEEQREEIFSCLSKFASANFSNTSVQSVKQDLFSTFFGECEGGGRCIPITCCFSQALFLWGNKYVSSSLKAFAENYNCRKQNKQTSKREAFAFSRLLNNFEGQLDSTTNSLPSNLMRAKGYKTLDDLSCYIAGIKGDFAIHLVTSNHVVAIYRTGDNYAYFDCNTAFVSGLKSVDQLMDVVEKGIKSAGYKIEEKGLLVEHFDVTKANSKLSNEDKQILAKEIKTERQLLAEQDKEFGLIKINGQELSRVQLYDFGTEIHVEGSVPVLINANMNLSSKKFQDHLDKKEISMTAREYLDHLKDSQNIEEVIQATRFIPFEGSKREIEEAQQTCKLKGSSLEQLGKGLLPKTTDETIGRPESYLSGVAVRNQQRSPGF